MVTSIREKVVEKMATEEFNKRNFSPSPAESRKSAPKARKKSNKTINLYKCHYYSRLGGEKAKSPIELIRKTKPGRSRSSSKGQGLDVTYLSGGVSDNPKHQT